MRACVRCANSTKDLLLLFILIRLTIRDTTLKFRVQSKYAPEEK